MLSITDIAIRYFRSFPTSFRLYRVFGKWSYWVGVEILTDLFIQLLDKKKLLKKEFEGDG